MVLPCSPQLICNAYNQVQLHHRSRDLTEVITHERFFCCLDNIIVYGEAPEIHDERLKAKEWAEAQYGKMPFQEE